MAYDGKLLARARNELDRQRAENQAEQQRRKSLVYNKIPEIEIIDNTLRSHMAELVRLTIGHSSDLAAQIGQLKERNLDLQMRRAELLNEGGFGMDYLDDIYSCTLCKDTGLYKGGVCRCVDRLYNKELTKELGTLMQRGDESFASFDLNLYPEDCRDTMSTVYSLCKRFAENFSATSPNLLLQGGPGLGKTFLSACIARVVAEKGFSVCYDSATAALDNFERARFSRDTEEGEAAAVRIRRMQDCDLMILDDLGTEMITPMSQSALYTLVNTRLVNGKKMIISTNYTDAELQKKYTPQIFSRISGEFTALPFVGKDIRQVKKGV
jgi:DNA replication protein DnaC